MENNLITIQLYSLLIFLISGILVGIFFDIFRILRKSFKTSDLVTYIEDIIFWIITGIFLLFVIFKFNNGEIRSYVIIGLILGIVIYMFNISKHFININVKILLFIKKIFKILMYPFKTIFNFIRKILLKPISFLVINIRKLNKNFSTFFDKKSKNIIKSSKKSLNTNKKIDL